ncbi:MAG: ribosome assembly RNA-binding protein YhbY [Christensenellales bacterium]
MEINSRQRAYLRSLASGLDPIVHIGKGGINANIIKQTDDALKARELVKGTVQQNSETSAKEACEELCRQTGAQPVQCIGRKFVLYRESENNKQIQLS